jgi:general secretion pathway protein G
MKAIWLTIILSLLTMPASAKPSAPKGSRGAQRSIARLSENLEAFKKAFGRYPTTDEGLEALVKCPPSLPQEKWPRPYLPAAWILKDPWGHPYVYRSPGLHLRHSFDFYSCGRDGTSATDGSDDDDINNWDPGSPHGWMWEYPMPGWQVPFGMGIAAGILFALTVWKELRRTKSTGNLHGILALLLVVAIGFPPIGLVDVVPGAIGGYYFSFVLVVCVPAVLLLQRSGSLHGSPASKTCANIASILFVLLLFWWFLRPAEAWT